jgi:hypothetical protein
MAAEAWRSPNGNAVAGLVTSSVLFFVVGLAPGYLFELTDEIDAAERCPEPVPTEQGWDGECVARIVERGPLYLGGGALAVSFTLGFAAILGIGGAAKGTWIRRASAVLLLGVLGMSWVLSMSSAAEPWQHVTSAFLGTLGAVAAIVLAEDRPRLASGVLMLSYLLAWTLLLVWNAAEGGRLARSGTGVAG